jgi:hypothetical protein
MPLREQILSIKGEYKAKTDDKGVPVQLVSNFGLRKGQSAFRHKKGAYYRFTVRALADVPPLLTNLRVADAVDALSCPNPDTSRASRILGIELEFRRQGEGIVYGALCLWLEKNKIAPSPDYTARAAALSPELHERLLRVRTDTLACPLQIVDVGAAENGNTPVVPEDWLDREFTDGFSLRQAIDTLPSRQLEAEATYCCHYGLHVLENSQWIPRVEVPVESLPAYGLRVRWNTDARVLESAIQPLHSAGEFESWLAENDIRMRFRAHRGPDNTLVWIACDRESLHNPEPAFHATEPSGVLTSRLQKSIRRGRGAARFLETTLLQLWASPSHSAPEQQFLRTSAARQMAWRLFISFFEDAGPYVADSEGRYLSLTDLVALAVLAHADPDIQWNECVRDLLIVTALLVQRNDGPGRNWDWRRGSRRAPIAGNSPLARVSLFALEAMPMMERDAEMLRQGCDYSRNESLVFAPLAVLGREELTKAAEVQIQQETLRASYDFHCTPQILLLLQGSLPFLPVDPQRHSLKALRQFIWENSSRLSTRNVHRPKTDTESVAILALLNEIQKHLCEKEACPVVVLGSGNEPGYKSVKEGPATPFANLCPNQEASASPEEETKARAGFLCLFGRTLVRKIGKRTMEFIAAGTSEAPFKVKSSSGKDLVYLEDDERDQPRLSAQQALLALLEKEGPLIVERPQAPVGYRWKGELPGKFRIEYLADPLQVGGVRFRAHGRDVPAFDASPWMERVPALPLVSLGERDARLIRQVLYIPAAQGEKLEEPGVLQNLLRQAVGTFRGEHGWVYNWVGLGEVSPIPAKIWQRMLTRLHNCFESCVEIGPVDRNGDAQYAAIDSLYEGTFWRLFNLLAFLYPGTVLPQGSMRFALKRETPGYVHLLESVEKLAFRTFERTACPETSESFPRVNTVLWDHQRTTVDRVLHGFLWERRRGFGDASCVGAGKTLSALAAMSGIAAVSHRPDADGTRAPGDGFLVLVREIPLIETWRAEIQKHCEGFDVVTQNAAGVLSGALGRHSILVTTLARMRETPVHQRWHLVVIDECLAVQNAEALQTQEAWRQVLCARYGVLLLSATFFRSRFEKLFYLLKMLRSDLPETREHLDALLSESIVCNLPKDDGWRWSIHVNRFPLSNAVRKGYDAILAESARDAKSVYLSLQNYLRARVDRVEVFRWVLETRLVPGDRALIFTASKEEADQLVSAFRGVISRFSHVPGPVAGRHVAASVAEAAHGVNHLVCCNVIVMRPPQPDLLPQMKGRLARPGQKRTDLRIEYLLLGDTIEEAEILRLEAAARFRSQYIMPLAEFYELAIGIRSPEE